MNQQQQQQHHQQQQHQNVNEQPHASLCEQGLAFESAIHGRSPNLQNNANMQTTCVKPSPRVLERLSDGFAAEQVDEFASRLAGVPNVHALWALANLHKGGKTHTANHFHPLWTTKAARATFSKQVAAVEQRNNELRDRLFDNTEQRNVVARVLWLMGGSSQAGKSTFLACMRAIANRDFAGIANGGVSAPLPSFTKDTPNSVEAAPYDLTLPFNIVDVGDTRGLVESQLVERVNAWLAMAIGVAAYGYDGEGKRGSVAAADDASALKRMASAVALCVNASQPAPLWLRLLRVATNGTLYLDTDVEADTQVSLSDPAAWAGAIALSSVLNRLGIQTFIVLTHGDCLRGSLADKCAELKAIYNACPFNVQMKDFVILPAGQQANGTEMSAYTYKKVAYIMLRLIRVTLQHHDFLAAAERAKPDPQPSLAQRAVAAIRGDPVVEAPSVDERLAQKLAPRAVAPPPAAAPVVLPSSTPPSPMIGWVLLLIALIVVFGATALSMQQSMLQDIARQVVDVANKFDVVAARAAAPPS